jgi:hypothetical protein
MTLDLSKPVQTRDGRKVRILCTERRQAEGWTIVGLIDGPGEDTIRCWKAGGDTWADNERLVNVPEPERTGWVNIYAPAHGHVTGTIIFDTREQAVRMPPNDPSRIACIEIKYRPGQGLET